MTHHNEYLIARRREQQLMAQPSLVLDHSPRTLDDLASIHAHLLGDVHSWAGTPRHTPLFKDATEFAAPQRMASLVKSAFDRLAKTNFDDRHQMIEDVAHSFAELNFAHPFADGNGRATRAALRLVLREHDLDLDLSSIAPAAWHQQSMYSIPYDERTHTPGVGPMHYDAMMPIFAKAIVAAQDTTPVPEDAIQQLVDASVIDPALTMKHGVKTASDDRPQIKRHGPKSIGDALKESAQSGAPQRRLDASKIVAPEREPHASDAEISL